MHPLLFIHKINTNYQNHKSHHSRSETFLQIPPISTIRICYKPINPPLEFATTYLHCDLHHQAKREREMKEREPFQKPDQREGVRALGFEIFKQGERSEFEFERSRVCNRMIKEETIYIGGHGVSFSGPAFYRGGD